MVARPPRRTRPGELRDRRRMMYAAAPGAAAWTPLSLGADLKFYTNSAAAHVTTDEPGTVPVTAPGDRVARRLDLSGLGNYRSQSTVGSRPTWAAGPTVAYAGGQLLTGPAVALTEAFTLYAWGTPSAVFNWVPFGNSTISDSAFIYNAATVYFLCGNGGGGGTVPYTGTTGAATLVRWRRTAGNVWYVAATGMAEVSGGSAAGTVTLDAEGLSAGAVSTLDGDHAGSLIVAADLVADGRDTAARAYLAANYGMTM